MKRRSTSGNQTVSTRSTKRGRSNAVKAKSSPRAPRTGTRKRTASTAAKSRAGTSAKRAGSKAPSRTGARTTATRARAGTGRARATAGRQTGAAKKGSAKGPRGGSAKLTTDHEEIRKWVESRGGHPATVAKTTRGNDPAGIIRSDFPGYSGKGSLKRIPWEEWFEMFDERRLGFLYQDKTSGGKQSRFSKIVCRT